MVPVSVFYGGSEENWARERGRVEKIGVGAKDSEISLSKEDECVPPGAEGDSIFQSQSQSTREKAAEKNEGENREDRSAGCYGESRKETVLQPGPIPLLVGLRGLQYETVFRQRDGLS
ncbi:hypothetical protein K0M31_012214 [Melipona bicolor]|uniref:Uncharacterized protein n=1 Tax=Melipona bicolor TaxID=60889 RepID=A0AA40KHK1_9HYME|nr:hypothetical protein K0M31_012214 [Melipona bicolor]